MIPRTLAEIEQLPCEVLTCRDVSGVLQADPTSLHMQAQKCPEKLGFPVIVHGTRVKIPKAPFVRFMRGI